MPSFYKSVPRIVRFSDVLDPRNYVPVPADWWIAMSDVEMSTAAIEQGRYRAVNVAGAAAIAATRNALSGLDLPFVFGGDGASILVPQADIASVREALAATVTWVRDTLQLDLRAALIPIAAAREVGFELSIIRYAASPNVDYAMFAGGGLAWATNVMKSGLYAVAPAPSGTCPDLTGLSCRFQTIRQRDDVVLSLIVEPCEVADPTAVRAALSDLLEIIEASPTMGRPLPDEGPQIGPPWLGIAMEAKAGRPLAGSLFLRRLWQCVRRVPSFLIFHSGMPVGAFSPRTYRRQLAANADFRKYDDGLRLTVACPVEIIDAIEARLTAACEKGLLRYGLHRQDAAIVTCVSPSPRQADHIHFIDGAAGGYARAALQLKQAVQ
ncbi:DUF3095 domain-containing protein [Methylobacterium gnaphalii]|nr:DUF3095 domain-containing protein [Methylobacterium gnaphalii]GJD71711.1 hypothetical protein MMMDOFMJ_4674 [Methylobacterium gnaphalii]